MNACMEHTCMWGTVPPARLRTTVLNILRSFHRFQNCSLITYEKKSQSNFGLIHQDSKIDLSMCTLIKKYNLSDYLIKYAIRKSDRRVKVKIIYNNIIYIYIILF